MKNKILLGALLVILSCGPVIASEFKLTYSQGNVREYKGGVSAGKSSAFVLQYGAAAEVRGGPGCVLETVKTDKSGETVLILKSGACFVRVIDDGSGAEITLKTPFVTLKSGSGAFYADYGGGYASVYEGSAKIEFKKRMAKLTANRTFKDGKITETREQGEDAWKQWNFRRDKSDIYIKMKAEKGDEAQIRKFITDSFGRVYCVGDVVYDEAAAPEDTGLNVSITAKDGVYSASGVIFSGLTGVMGVINSGEKKPGENLPYAQTGLMPVVYEVAGSAAGIIEQADGSAMKNGRKAVIEAEDLSEGDYLEVEKTVRLMPGFISGEWKKYHNKKAVFEVMLYGTGYDIAEVLLKKYEKTNISIWKYSKNIVKLRVLKVKG